MLLPIGLALLLSGMALIRRGQKALVEAESCLDPQEIDALKSVGLRRKRLGRILIGISIPVLVLAAGCLLLGLLAEPEPYPWQ